MSNKTIIWKGASGTEYKYWIYDLPPNFTAVAGNYIFAKETEPSTYAPVYIGETDGY